MAPLFYVSLTWISCPCASFIITATPPRLRLYHPKLILYQAEVGVHQADKLGYLALSDTGVRQRGAIVFDCAKQHGLAIAAISGGGYQRDW
jgi:acetoin utilization deacetylase AcuC-like enzyme